MKEQKERSAKLSTGWKITLLALLFAVVMGISCILAAFLHVKNILKVSERPEKRMYKKYSVEEEQIGGRSVFTFANKSGEDDFVILYLHGGSYKYSFFNAHWNFIGYLIDALHCKVIAPDYPVVPEADYRNVFDMMVPLYEKIASAYPGRLVLMGDSAGGGLSLALSEDIAENRPDLPLPVQTVLLSPWLDVTMENEEVIALQADDFFLDLNSLKAAGKAYAGDRDPSYYKASPLFGNIDRLQNIVVFTGTRDMLYPDAKRLKERGGDKVDLREYPGMFHVWFLADGMPLPQIKRAREEIVSSVRTAFA